MNSLKIAGLALVLLAAPLRAQEVVQQSARPETSPNSAIRFETRIDAALQQRVFVARVDLSDPKVEVRVARGGEDPDGEGEYQTTLQTPSVIAAREHFDVAINGDFFRARQTVDVEGAKSGYVSGKWASAVGPAATDGFLWAPAAQARPILMIDSDGRAHILATQNLPANARQVVAGSDLLWLAGARVLDNQSAFSTARHPRTAVGLSDNGKTLILVVADGRDAKGARGLSLSELADLMKSLGCSDALNLDGGGSSEMLARDAQSGRLQILNRPSDGRERAVANVLGVSVRGTVRVPGLANAPDVSAAP